MVYPLLLPLQQKSIGKTNPSVLSLEVEINGNRRFNHFRGEGKRCEVMKYFFVINGKRIINSPYFEFVQRNDGKGKLVLSLQRKERRIDSVPFAKKSQSVAKYQQVWDFLPCSWLPSVEFVVYCFN